MPFLGLRVTEKDVEDIESLIVKGYASNKSDFLKRALVKEIADIKRTESLLEDQKARMGKVAT